MWKCPECGREFKDQNQKHICEIRVNTVDAYIAAQPERIQPLLKDVRNAISNALPDAQERISWRMPTFRDKHNIIHFAAYTNHIGLYPGPRAIEHFSQQLSAYRTSKGAVQFSYDKPLPLELIAEIAKWCRETGNHH